MTIYFCQTHQEYFHSETDPRDSIMEHTGCGYFPLQLSDVILYLNHGYELKEAIRRIKIVTEHI